MGATLTGKCYPAYTSQYHGDPLGYLGLIFADDALFDGTGPFCSKNHIQNVMCVGSTSKIKTYIRDYHAKNPRKPIPELDQQMLTNTLPAGHKNQADADAIKTTIDEFCKSEKEYDSQRAGASNITVRYLFSMV
jgi:hypothetical protein